MMEEYVKCEKQIVSNGYQMELNSEVSKSPNRKHEHTATMDTKVNKLFL